MKANQFKATRSKSIPPEQHNEYSIYNPSYSSQDIAEIAKIYELLFQALDQRMNVENVKKSRRKGVANVGRISYQDEIEYPIQGSQVTEDGDKQPLMVVPYSLGKQLYTYRNNTY